MIHIHSYTPYYTVITLGFEVGDYNISEPDGPLEVCVVASGTIGTNLPAVTFSYTDGSAEGEQLIIALCVVVSFLETKLQGLPLNAAYDDVIIVRT